MLRCHAKINLALAVGAPQAPKGYHPIASWFTCIDLHDELSLAPPRTEHSEWTIRWTDDAPRPTPIDWPLDKDLAVRAHRLLEQTVARALPIRATLRKRIPVGAGLGGGSSDAAAALTGLNAVFDLGLSLPRLRELSASLGSDVAYFIGGAESGDDSRPAQPGSPALVTGFGERVERLPRLRGRAVLIFPPFGCPTGPVYQAFDRAALPGPTLQVREARIRALAATSGELLSRAPLFNDLEAPACLVEPRLADLLAHLRAGLDTPVHLTGSGSTIFVLARDEGHADALSAAARRLCPETVSLVTTLV